MSKGQINLLLLQYAFRNLSLSTLQAKLPEIRLFQFLCQDAKE